MLRSTARSSVRSTCRASAAAISMQANCHRLTGLWVPLNVSFVQNAACSTHGMVLPSMKLDHVKHAVVRCPSQPYTMIAVHAGAGYHSVALEAAYKRGAQPKRASHPCHTAVTTLQPSTLQTLPRLVRRERRHLPQMATHWLPCVLPSECWRCVRSAGHTVGDASSCLIRVTLHTAVPGTGLHLQHPLQVPLPPATEHLSWMPLRAG